MHSDLVDLADAIRSGVRQLVNEFKSIANSTVGTDNAAIQDDIILELGNGVSKSEAHITTLLNLDSTRTRRALEDLMAAGKIKNDTSGHHDSEGTFVLTTKGSESLYKIKEATQQQVMKTLSPVPIHTVEAIRYGIQTYATSLHAQRTGSPIKSSETVQIAQGYRPGILARALQMHIDFYSRLVGFGKVFEGQLASGLADLLSRLKNSKNNVWVASLGDKIVGTVFIDGEDLGANRAHLRAFIVDDRIRGGGVGRRLLSQAVAFVDEQGFAETHLWTFQGLDAARRLYESVGFRLEKEEKGTQWGHEVVEQLFVRKLNA